MTDFRAQPTELDGVLLLDPLCFPDDRGWFAEVWQRDRYADIGIPELFQINQNHSRRGVLRGLHYQEPHPQGKMVWFPRGEVWDVVADVRVGSPTFGKWQAFELSETNRRQLWIPEGYAHGFCVLSDYADCLYACTSPYAPGCDRSVAYDDPTLGIDWPIEAPVISDKDRQAPKLADAVHLPRYRDARG